MTLVVEWNGEKDGKSRECRHFSSGSIEKGGAWLVSWNDY